MATASPDEGEPSGAVVADTEAAGQRVQEHGWPNELRAAQSTIQQGAPPWGTEEWDTYVAAIDETEEFVRANCDVDPAVLRFLSDSVPEAP